MKQITFAFFALVLFACGSKSKPDADFTPEEMDAITFGLNVKNVHTAAKYRSDSMLERTRMETQGVPAAEVKLKMDAFYSTWHKDIFTDTAVTMAEYLQHCKERNADPKEEFRFIDTYGPNPASSR